MSSKMRNKELVKLARQHRVASSVTDEAIFDFLSASNCPRSLAVWLLYANKEHQQLVDLECYAKDYNSPFAFRDAYAATNLLSKSDFLKIAVAKDVAAFEKFFKFEDLCRQTNSRFRNLSLDPNYHGSNVWLLNATIRKIESILGDFVADEFVDSANWGPGVTTLIKGCDVSAINKFHCENGITRDMYALICDIFPVAYPGWWMELRMKYGEIPFNFQVGNSVITVPKNSKTDRVIAVEPGINLWFQKAAGSMIKRRLLRAGIDLRTQDNNQRLARLSSIDGRLATVDFSSASDSISKELVRELLPPRWYNLLNSMRSTFGTHNNAPIRWEKFSSMGNGFTFELESLIFYAAAFAVREYLHEDGEISVFGDDVILPERCYELFADFSRFLGFTVNLKKSCYNSPFRESCGAHYYLGINCKPVFLKERLRDVSAIYKLANSVRMLSHRYNSHYGCDSRFRNCWKHLSLRIPKPLRFRIPYGKGDGGLVSNFDEAVPTRARNGIEGYYYSALAEVGKTRQFDGMAVLFARLKTIEGTKINALSPQVNDTEYNNSYTLRGRTRLCITRSLANQWYNLGSWI